MQAPEFWQRQSLLGGLLRPVGAAFDAAGSLRRALTRPYHAPVPVICVGNLVAGGAGKTPTAMALGRHVSGRLSVGFVTRGYRGRLRGPVAVDPARHDFRDIGDEALLLSEVAPTWVAANRAAGARQAVAAGATVVILDDGLQNPGLRQDLGLIVVDGGAGFGNGRLLPAGPMRESIAQGCRRASVAIIIGEPRDGLSERLEEYLPVALAQLAPEDPPERWAGRRLLAFAGIGRPQKFFDTLASIGARPELSVGFPDHHSFRRDQIEKLIAEAERGGLTLTTTSKDWVRIPSDLRAQIEVFRVRLTWKTPRDEALVLSLVDSVLGAVGRERGE